MNLIKLHVLVLIEKHKKVTEVANELRLKQPTVTFHMKSLEDELGISLYKSRGGRTYLSDAGKAIYPFAQQMTSLYKETLNTAALYREQDNTSFQAGAEDLYAPQLLSGIRQLKEEFPEILYNVRLYSEAELVEAFSKKEIDVILVEQNVAAGLTGSYEPLFEDELVVLCGPDHHLAEGGNIPLEDLERENWINYETASVSRLMQLLKDKHHINLPGTIAVSSFEAALQAVEMGMGLLLATKQASANLASDNKKIAALSLPEALQLEKFTIGILYQEDEVKTQLAEKLASAVKHN